MNSRNISADLRIVINIGGQEFNLTKREAEELFFSLKQELKIQDPVPVYPIEPYDPNRQIGPAPWIQPHTPTWPPYGPPIWCQQPSSTCNL